MKVENAIPLGSMVTLVNLPEKPWLVKSITVYLDGSHTYSLGHGTESYACYEQELVPKIDSKRIGFEVK